MLTYNYSILQDGFVIWDTEKEKITKVYENTPKGMIEAANHVKEAKKWQTPATA